VSLRITVPQRASRNATGSRRATHTLLSDGGWYDTGQGVWVNDDARGPTSIGIIGQESRPTMTRIMHLTVDSDGRVEVPGAEPGQTVTVEIKDTIKEPKRLTLATARTDEERDAVIEDILRSVRALRLAAGDDGEPLSTAHGDMLYDENGLPA
jgi:hypothetical protein